MDILSRQASLQLKAPHPRHAHVQYQTSRAAQLRRVQKVLRGDESGGDVTDGLQQTDDGFDNRSVVVHNRNQRNIGCAQICRRQESDSLNLATVNASTVRKMASIILWYGK